MENSIQFQKAEAQLQSTISMEKGVVSTETADASLVFLCNEGATGAGGQEINERTLLRKIDYMIMPYDAPQQIL
jgi:hypothetical protein